MGRITEEQKSFLKLVKRSLKGNESAKVSDTLWEHTQKIAKQIPELLEIDTKNQCVSLTHEGEALVEWL